MTNQISHDQIGIIIVDHGSRREESNQMLLDVVAMFRSATDYRIIEPAHMELAEPSIQTAFDRCAHQGARLVVVHPYFLLPGRHWDRDIPELAAAAAERHKDISLLVTAPLGLHPRMADVMRQRIDDCLAHATGEGEACPLCVDTDKCRIRKNDQ